MIIPATAFWLWVPDNSNMKKPLTEVKSYIFFVNFLIIFALSSSSWLGTTWQMVMLCSRAAVEAVSRATPELSLTVNVFRDDLKLAKFSYWAFNALSHTTATVFSCSRGQKVSLKVMSSGCPSCPS